MDKGKVAFQPRLVEVGVAGGGQKGGIDIGSDQLIARHIARSATRQKAGAVKAPGQERAGRV